MSETSSTARLPTVVFCDFDNTITTCDVYDALLAQFADVTAIESQLAARQISPRVAYIREISLLRASGVELEAYVRDCVEIDPGFPEFAAALAERNVPIVILSDGFDFYIDLILEKHGLAHIPYFANHLEFGHDGKPTMYFPHFRADCRMDMGNCKCEHVKNYPPNLRRTVYIGDGPSDTCPVRYADVVCAKGRLQEYLRKNGIGHVAFEWFSDLIPRLEEILG